MKTVKRTLRLLPMLLAWLFLCWLAWGLVFDRLADTAPEHKLQLYIDASVPAQDRFAGLLEKACLAKNGEEGPLGPDADIRLIQVRELSYAMMGQSPFNGGDLFILPSSAVDQYTNHLAALPPEAKQAFEDGWEIWYVAGRACGVRADGAKGLLAGGDIGFDPDESYFIFAGSGSKHIQDGAAFALMKLLLLPAEGHE
ncbi:MAG: hypothetical protein IK140_07155 [Clostridia bacterium]|nr:hypothetical protein [Clostridia bacterium]